MAQSEDIDEDCPRCKKLLNIIQKNQQTMNCECCDHPEIAEVLCYKCNLYLCCEGRRRHNKTHKIIQARPVSDVPRVINFCNHGVPKGQPWGIAFNKDGSKWAVADNSNHCVHLYDDCNKCVKEIGGKGEKKGEFQHPEGIAFDSSDHLYVVDNSNHRVQKFDVESTYAHVSTIFGCQGNMEGQLNHPHGISICDDIIYVADTGNHRISIFKTDGVVCDNFGSEHLGKPHDVAILKDRQQLFVADYDKNCIHIFTLDGKYLTNFGTGGQGMNQINSPYGVTTHSNDSERYIVVADTKNHCVKFFKDDDYKCTRCVGSHGVDEGQFDNPCGVAISPNNTQMYVSDRYNNRIQIFML